MVYFIALNRFHKSLSGWRGHLHELAKELFQGFRQPRFVDDVEDALLQICKEIIETAFLCAESQVQGWVVEVPVEVLSNCLQSQDCLSQEPSQSRLTPSLPGEPVGGDSNLVDHHVDDRLHTEGVGVGGIAM